MKFIEMSDVSPDDCYDEDEPYTGKCPFCDTQLYSEFEGEYEYGSCEHLRFVWLPGPVEQMLSFENGFDGVAFSKQVAELAVAVVAENSDTYQVDEDELKTDPSTIEFFNSAGFVTEILKKLPESSELNALGSLDVYQEQMWGNEETGLFFGLKKP